MPTAADVQFGEIAVRHKLITRKQHDEALKVLKRLESQLKKQGKKKRPRLVDVLVQRELISGAQAKSVENARIYRQIRLDDKLYGRVALKSKFVTNDQVEKGLERQKKDYLKGKPPRRLAEFLLEADFLTEAEDEAIQEAIAKLDAQEYVGRGEKAKRKAGVASEDDLSGEGLSDDDLSDEDLSDDDLSEMDVEEIDDLEEVGSGSGGSGIELDLDADDDDEESGSDASTSGKGSGIDLDLDLDDDDDDDAVESLDDDDDVEAIDSQIDMELSGLDDADLDIGSGSGSGSKPRSNTPAPAGLSSDVDLDDLDDDDDLDDADSEVADDDDDDDLEDLDDDDGGSGSGADDLDIDDLDLDDLDD